MKKIAIWTQDFKQLITDWSYYIDKTKTVTINPQKKSFQIIGRIFFENLTQLDPKILEK